MALTEGHGHNKSPFFVLEDAHTKDEDGWLARAERVGVIHEARREAMATEGYQLAPIPALVHGGNGLASMAWKLEQGLNAQQSVPELDGLVVVLAPTVLEQPESFANDVLTLVRTPSLTRVRYIVVEVGNALTEPLASALGNAAQFSDCIIDPMVYRREQTETLAAAAAAPVGASPEVSMGGAGPKQVIAPPRHGKPPRDAVPSPEQKDLLAKELGPAVALLGPGGALLRQRIAGAALALQQQRFAAAIELQTAACKQCLEAGLLRFACILEVTLAAYLLHAGEPARARTAFETAAARAETNGLFDVAAQALLGLGAVLIIQKDPERSTATYARAGELAQKAQEPLLAIEAYRTAGQVALRARAEAAAVAAWKRALTIADGAPPDVLAHSSASTVARALAKVMEGNGSFAAAQSLVAQAEDYERAAQVPEAGSEARVAPPTAVGTADVVGE